MKSKLIVTCGLQCSGKSTKAKELSRQYNATILSSDRYRYDFPDDNNETIFKKIYSKMNELLIQNQNVIIDSTAISIKARKQIFNNLKVDCEKICYIMNTPIEVCRKRLEERNNSDYPNKVPLEVLDKYYKSFEIPFMEEGWDVIMMDRTIPADQIIPYDMAILKKCVGFNQHNKHHTQDLDKHLLSVVHYLEERHVSSVLFRAGLFHDVGKLDTQFYKPNDENAHYYNHANVGAYNLMCNTYYNGNFDNLTYLFYINYHMKPHDWQTEKSKEKWKRIFGEEKYSNLLLFNEADKYRGE